MPTFLIRRHGSNASNQPMTQTADVCFVEADNEDAAYNLARKKITVYNNQQLEAISEDDADNDDWNNAVEDGIPVYRRAESKLKP